MTVHRIRPALPDDLPGIETLSDQVQTLHANARPDIFRMPVDLSGRRAFLDHALSDDLWSLTVAPREDQIMGYTLTQMMHKDGPIRAPHIEGHIHQICVAADHRRRGVGRALLQHAIAAFHQNSVDRITAAYWTFNAASRALFAAQGFMPVVTTAELDAP